MPVEVYAAVGRHLSFDNVFQTFRMVCVWQIQEGYFGFIYVIWFSLLNFICLFCGLSENRYLGKPLSRIFQVKISVRNMLTCLSLHILVLLFHGYLNWSSVNWQTYTRKRLTFSEQYQNIPITPLKRNLALPCLMHCFIAHVLQL